MHKIYKGQRENRGFTLIELLVVISIIGLLSSVVLASLNGARQKARVAKRLSDLNQVQLALENYYSTNNAYPTTGGAWRSQCYNWGTGGVGYTQDQVIPGLVPTYLSVLSADPSMNASGNQNCYLYLSNGTDYKFLDYNVTDMSVADLQSHPTQKDPTRSYNSGPCWNGDTSIAISVYSPGMVCQ